MKVHELIDELRGFDPDLEIEFTTEPDIHLVVLSIYDNTPLRPTPGKATRVYVDLGDPQQEELT